MKRINIVLGVIYRVLWITKYYGLLILNIIQEEKKRNR